MKQIIILIALVIAAITAIGQDTVRINFDFSVEVVTDTIYRNNGTKIIEKVSVYPPLFTPNNEVAFNFKVESYNATDPDTLVYIRTRKEQAKITSDEMNAVLYGERVYTWLERYAIDGLEPYKPKDMTKALGELIYYYKIEGN